MIAQDTGSAITGPARADLYFGAGPEAARVAGRLKNNIRFAILVPRALDPSPAAQHIALPVPRPSALIAKLFPPPATLPASPTAAPPATPQVPVSGGPATVVGKASADKAPQSQPATAGKAGADKPAATATDIATAVPLPQARPALPGDKPRTLRRQPRG